MTEMIEILAYTMLTIFLSIGTYSSILGIRKTKQQIVNEQKACRLINMLIDKTKEI